VSGKDPIEPRVGAIGLILPERIREAEKIAAQLRVQILGEFAVRLAEAATLDDARKMLSDEIEMQRKIAGEDRRGA